MIQNQEDYYVEGEKSRDFTTESKMESLMSRSAIIRKAVKVIAAKTRYHQNQQSGSAKD